MATASLAPSGGRDIQSTLFSLGRRPRRHRRAPAIFSGRHLVWCLPGRSGDSPENAPARTRAQSRARLPDAPCQRRHRFARFVNLHRSGRLHVLLLGLPPARLGAPRRLGNRGLPLAQPASASHAALHCANICSVAAAERFRSCAVSSARWRTPRGRRAIRRRTSCTTRPRSAGRVRSAPSSATTWPRRAARAAPRGQTCI